MAILHPQECYLLEKFISPEHYAATRDAIIAYIDAHEEAFARYLREMPLNSRKLPLWQQADMVWGNRVLPNIRSARERYTEVFILRTHNDVKAFNIGHTMSNINKGIAECWGGWMTKEEIETISELGRIASVLGRRLSVTIRGNWDEGDLTYDGYGDEGYGIYSYDDIPAKIPRYELDTSIRIELGDNPEETGIYLPDIDYAPARFISANYGQPASALQGVQRSEYVSSDGKRSYSWKDSEWAKTGWTLIRRVEGEFIDVPPEGFFPEGKPEELYNWPLQEIELLQEKRVRITRWSGDLAPFDARRGTTLNGTTQYTQTRAGQAMPEFEDKGGKMHRACWSLLERDDGGSMFTVSPEEEGCS
ncbi:MULTISPECIES: type VI secretion protein ImpA [Enterobacter cloacae complex]|uniref:type VI secretion protein ImpA n=1 Tax=Enterobacter cloacae complex TaxID=354276 RepID=UPI00097CBAD3|nr:type VI secretion protein ImpA [Enterobacter chengduensis]MBT1935486.1 type VI secretion protein ImpA [Enterobacter chengduensis]MBT1963930.1 type VI secretion protein ImpA [Enterobacter chengduensis]MCK6820248.1 type VI secretion protein ImpA [Enterobacter chengduensis]MCK7170825.1 type VI secretion protein ImpA [Enterobacter chengduensis]MCM7676530.1 type VI secretion protein ImpA [Enterobacter chengduensis]